MGCPGLGEAMWMGCIDFMRISRGRDGNVHVCGHGWIMGKGGAISHE